MAVKLSALRIDRQKELEGDWVTLDIADGLSVQVRIRGTGYAPFALAKKYMQLRLERSHHSGVVSDDVFVAENGRLYADHILLDWRDLLDDDGRPIEFTPTRAREILCDMAYRELLGLVMLAAPMVGRSPAANGVRGANAQIFENSKGQDDGRPTG